MKNHVILRHLYHYLLEESDKLGCHAGVIQVTLSLTHENSYNWRISIFHIADPNNDMECFMADLPSMLSLTCLDD